VVSHVLSGFGRRDPEKTARICVQVFGHEPKMPLLTELENPFVLVLQICRAYGA
jgi:hypothetical protein